MQAEYTHGNAVALEQLMKDPDVELRQFPDEVMQHLKSIAREIVEEMAANDPMADKIYRSWSSFLEQSIPNSRITEHAFLATRR
jgi:TRAP-type mannitol/chloroaromatic compound transport system substrate-binding protein